MTRYAITLTGKSGKKYSVSAELTKLQADTLTADGFDVCEIVYEYEIDDRAIPLFAELIRMGEQT
jgi:hypothetical protein